MEITKAIICISCGKRFLVDREEYEERLEESLCDQCRNAITAAEDIDEADSFSEISKAVTKMARNVSGKISAMLQNATNKQPEQNNNLGEDD